MLVSRAESRNFLAFFFMVLPPSVSYTLSLHDALPISVGDVRAPPAPARHGDQARATARVDRSEEHTSGLQSLRHLVCRLLLEKKKTNYHNLPRSHSICILNLKRLVSLLPMTKLN